MHAVPARSLINAAVDLGTAMGDTHIVCTLMPVVCCRDHDGIGIESVLDLNLSYHLFLTMFPRAFSLLLAIIRA